MLGQWTICLLPSLKQVRLTITFLYSHRTDLHKTFRHHRRNHHSFPKMAHSHPITSTWFATFPLWSQSRGHAVLSPTFSSNSSYRVKIKTSLTLHIVLHDRPRSENGAMTTMMWMMASPQRLRPPPLTTEPQRNSEGSLTRLP